MNVERVGFWSRLAAWIWGTDRSPAFDAGSSTKLPGHDPSFEPDAGGRVVGSSFSPPSDSSKSGSGRTSAASVPQANDRLIELVDAIQKHLTAQSERSELMTAALHRLADGLERFPEASKAELHLLERVAADSGATATNVKKLSDSLVQLPELADAQREALVTIHRELERGRESGQQVRETLGGVGRAIAALGEATASLRPMLDRMRTELSSGQDRLVLIVERQAARMTWFSAYALGAAGLGILFSLIALFRSK